MKDYLLELVSKQEGLNAKMNIMREYLQAYILRIMHNGGVFRSTAFVGGTALRFLYGLPRFSEDLDFSVIRQDAADLSALVKKIDEELALAGYEAAVTYTGKKAVRSAFVKFPGLMYEAGISPLRGQNISVKIEIDANPPAGAAVKTMIVNKYFPVAFLSYDIPSLFAGKIHALLSRRYVKGRDFFDLGWYLSKWHNLTPNIVFLANALKQTGWRRELPKETTWVNLVYKAVREADWQKVKRDVENFLENPKDADIFTKENVLRLIKP